MLTRRRCLLSIVAALALLGAIVAPAGADPPPGDWTLVNKDQYRHYACKQKLRAGGWGLKTATRYAKGAPRDVGVYLALARGSNRNLVVERTSNDRENGYIRTFLRGARQSDRLWMQAAAYGPVDPWSDGFPVRRITRCASPA
jgi:hypothetical protein